MLSPHNYPCLGMAVVSELSLTFFYIRWFDWDPHDSTLELLTRLHPFTSPPPPHEFPTTHPLSAPDERASVLVVGVVVFFFFLFLKHTGQRHRTAYRITREQLITHEEAIHESVALLRASRGRESAAVSELSRRDAQEARRLEQVRALLAASTSSPASCDGGDIADNKLADPPGWARSGGERPRSSSSSCTGGSDSESSCLRGCASSSSLQERARAEASAVVGGMGTGVGGRGSSVAATSLSELAALEEVIAERAQEVASLKVRASPRSSRGRRWWRYLKVEITLYFCCRFLSCIGLFSWPNRRLSTSSWFQTRCPRSCRKRSFSPASVVPPTPPPIPPPPLRACPHFIASLRPSQQPSRKMANEALREKEALADDRRRRDVAEALRLRDQERERAEGETSLRSDLEAELQCLREELADSRAGREEARVNLGVVAAACREAEAKSRELQEHRRVLAREVRRPGVRALALA